LNKHLIFYYNFYELNMRKNILLAQLILPRAPTIVSKTPPEASTPVNMSEATSARANVATANTLEEQRALFRRLRHCLRP
jgi:hypothetical protein